MNQGKVIEAALGSTETTETTLGTYTVPPVGINRIVGVSGVITEQAQTTSEGTDGQFRLGFDTTNGSFEFPATIFGGSAGTIAGGAASFHPQIIPCDIPVVPGTVITAYAKTFLAQTGTCRGKVWMMFADR